MDQLNSTTQHQKGKHLSFEERVITQRQNLSILRSSVLFLGERQQRKANRLARRFIAKGERISDYGIDAITRIGPV